MDPHSSCFACSPTPYPSSSPPPPPPPFPGPQDERQEQGLAQRVGRPARVQRAAPQGHGRQGQHVPHPGGPAAGRCCAPQHWCAPRLLSMRTMPRGGLRLLPGGSSPCRDLRCQQRQQRSTHVSEAPTCSFPLSSPNEDLSMKPLCHDSPILWNPSNQGGSQLEVL